MSYDLTLVQGNVSNRSFKHNIIYMLSKVAILIQA